MAGIQPLHGPCREFAVLRDSQRWNAGLGASFLHVEEGCKCGREAGRSQPAAICVSL